jgi:SAM-dependent methyltransferase
MTDHFLRKSCRLCESPTPTKVVNLPGTPIGDNYLERRALMGDQTVFPMDLYFCEDCGHIQLLDIVSPELIYRNYIYETSVSRGLVDHFNSYAKKIVKKFELEKDSLTVDIGCNDGTFLKALKNEGMRVLGIEPATRIAKNLNEDGVKTLCEFFDSKIAEEIESSEGLAKLISANNVMANIDDLSEMMKGVSSLLSEDGIFIFESGYGIDLIKNKVLDNIYHEHISYFRVKPMVKFLDRYGLEIIDVDHTESKGGSIRCIIQRKNGKRAIDTSVAQIINKEVEAGYDDVNTYLNFGKEMEDNRDSLINLLKEYKAQGKTISGYGASVGVTTLLYYYGLSEYVDCLYDDNPIRDGLLSPGHKIPVKNSEKIYEDRPDIIVCFPWRYIAPIKKRHSKFIDGGGIFVLPLPLVKVDKL